MRACKVLYWFRLYCLVSARPHLRVEFFERPPSKSTRLRVTTRSPRASTSGVRPSPTSGSRAPITVNTLRTRNCRSRAGERCRRSCSQRPPQQVPWYSLWSLLDQRWRLAWRSWALACGWYRCWSQPWRTTDTTCTTRSRGRSTNRCSGASTTSWWLAADPQAPWSPAGYPRCVSHARRLRVLSVDGARRPVLGDQRQLVTANRDINDSRGSGEYALKHDSFF